jgi:hypothetical protein
MRTHPTANDASGAAVWMAQTVVGALDNNCRRRSTVSTVDLREQGAQSPLAIVGRVAMRAAALTIDAGKGGARSINGAGAGASGSGSEAKSSA